MSLPNIELPAKVYERYIVSKDNLDYEFDENVIGVTVCKIEKFGYKGGSDRFDDDDKPEYVYRMYMRTPWGKLIRSNESREDVIGKKSSFINNLFDELGYSLTNVSDIHGEEIPIPIENVYCRYSNDDSLDDVCCEFKTDIDLVRELDTIDIKFRLDEPVDNALD